MSTLKPPGQQGFTIVELMIATAVLSTILLLVTALMLNIGHLYYKGVNQARVQSNVRTVTDEVAQQLRLGNNWQSATGANNQRAYCVGNLRYTYVIGAQIGHPAPGSSAPVYRHVLWRDSNPTPSSCSITDVNLTAAQPSVPARNGVELMAPKTRLIDFTITGASPYNISYGVAYGDDDLLCSPPPGPGTVNDSCLKDAPAMTNLNNFTNGRLLCKDGDSRHFCATAKLNTSVVRRLPT